MLAFILLVVLGGGIGLLAVSLAESPKPATDRGPFHRARNPGSEPEPEIVGPAPEQVAELEPVAASNAGATSDPAPVPRRRPDPRTVPPAYTAVEGPFADVASPPWWRRMLSLVALVVIVILIGVGLAAVAAAVIGAIAELLDAAVG